MKHQIKNIHKGSGCGLVGRASLPISEVRSSNPVISKNLYLTFMVNCIEKTKIKNKRWGMVLLKKSKKN